MNVKTLSARFLRWMTIGLWVFVILGIGIFFAQRLISRIAPSLLESFISGLPYSIEFDNVAVRYLSLNSRITISQLNILDKKTHRLLFHTNKMVVHIALWKSLKHWTFLVSSFEFAKAELGAGVIRKDDLNSHDYLNWLPALLTKHFSQSLKLKMKALSLPVLTKGSKKTVLNNLKMTLQMQSKEVYLEIVSAVLGSLGRGEFHIVSNLNKQILFDRQQLTGTVYLKFHNVKLNNLDHFKFLNTSLKTYLIKQDALNTELWLSLRDSIIQKIYGDTSLEKLNTASHPHKWVASIYIKRHLSHFTGTLFNISRRDPKHTTAFPSVMWSFDTKAQKLPFEVHLDTIKFLLPNTRNNSQLDLKYLDNNQIAIKIFTHFETNDAGSIYTYLRSFTQKFFVQQPFKILRHGSMNGDLSWRGVFTPNNHLVKKQIHARVHFKNLQAQYKWGALLTIPQGVIDTDLKDYLFLIDSAKLQSLQFENIKANLNFSKKPQLTLLGTVNKQPFILTTDHLSQWKKNHSINALIKGSLDPNYLLLNVTQMPFKIRGNALYTARLFIDFYKNKWSLSGNSNLLGVHFILPGLYLKSEDEILPASWQMNFSNELLTCRIKLREQMIALLQFYKEKNRLKFLKGELNLGENKAHLPKERGLFVNANVPHLSWDKGQKFLNNIFYSTESKTHAITYHLPNFLKQLRVHITRFDLFSNAINQLHVVIDFLPKTIQASLNSAEVVGRLAFLGEAKIHKVIGKFEKIDIEKRFSLKHEDLHRRPSYFSGLSRASFDLDIQDLRYGLLYFNQLKFTAAPFDGHLKINRFFGRNTLFSFEAVGNAFAGNENSTLKLQGKISASDVGDLLTQWNLTSRLQKGVGEGTFDLTAQHFLEQRQKYTGRMNIQISNGVITQLSPRIQSKVNWGEFLNALDVSTLWKKIFSTPKISNGLSFNTITGNISFTNQKFSTNHLLIESDIAQINTTGEIDLGRHRYDIHLQINPYLTSSLPVVLGTVGTPILGGAAFIANKVLEPWASQKMKHDYHVTGTY